MCYSMYYDTIIKKRQSYGHSRAPGNDVKKTNLNVSEHDQKG